MFVSNGVERVFIRIVGRKKGDYHSDEARAEFLNFLIIFLFNKPNLKIWRPRKCA